MWKIISWSFQKKENEWSLYSKAHVHGKIHEITDVKNQRIHASSWLSEDMSGSMVGFQEMLWSRGDREMTGSIVEW